jgi:Pyruvate/2-oxoacid:ferredoxin oxidoreductase gamma subunit
VSLEAVSAAITDRFPPRLAAGNVAAAEAAHSHVRDGLGV